MALNETVLAAALEADIKAIVAEDDDTRKKLAEAIASTVIDHFKAFGVVTVLPGIPVATAGSPTAQTGATTASGTGTIA